MTVADPPSSADPESPSGNGPREDERSSRPIRSWAEARREIAEQPANHGRFALGCSAAVIITLVVFFLLRVFVLR